MTSVAFAMLYLVQAAAAPLIGRLIDRYKSKRIITLGGFIAGLGLVFLSLTSSLLHFYLGYAVTGLGCSVIGLVPFSTLLKMVH